VSSFVAQMQKMMGSFTLRAGEVLPLEHRPRPVDVSWCEVQCTIGKHRIGSFQKFTETASTGKRKAAATPSSAASSTPRRKTPNVTSIPTRTPKRSHKQVERPPVDDDGRSAVDDTFADLEDLFDPRLFASDLAPTHVVVAP
jgi:hypothetical protein